MKNGATLRAVSLIELDGVEKRYGELRALKDVTLSLEEGRIGLLGLRLRLQARITSPLP